MENYKNVKGYICDVECKSARAEFIREFYSWFMANDREQIMSAMDEKIVWEIVGDVTVEGIEEVRKFFNQPLAGAGERQMIEARVDGILAEGLWSCSFGTTVMSNGDCFAFNDVIRFKAGEAMKIEVMKSYIVKL